MYPHDIEDPTLFLQQDLNNIVLERAKANLLSSMLAKRQLKFFGRIALMDDSNILRSIVFADNSFAKPPSPPRRRGRPRACWIDELHSMATRVAGSELDLFTLLTQCSSSSMKPWLSSIDSFLSPSDIS